MQTLVFEKMTVPEQAADLVRQKRIENMQSNINGNSCSPPIDQYLNASGCGIRPICAFTKNCKNKNAAWQDCISKSADTKANQAKADADFNTQIAAALSTSNATSASGLSTGAWIGISVFGLALIGTVAYVVLKRKG